MLTVALASRWPVIPAKARSSDRGTSEAADLERQWIEACQRGEREAFDRLVERHQQNVYRLCYRYVNNHHDASDLAQEVFLKAYRSIRRFRGESAFATWLYRIGVNTCLSFRGSRRPAPDELEEDVADGGPSALDEMQREERARWVRIAISRLPAKQRMTLILKLYQDLTHEEIAKALGTSVGTAKANLFHALANLRKTLSAEARRRDAKAPD